MMNNWTIQVPKNWQTNFVGNKRHQFVVARQATAASDVGRVLAFRCRGAQQLFLLGRRLFDKVVGDVVQYLQTKKIQPNLFVHFRNNHLWPVNVSIFHIS